MPRTTRADNDTTGVDLEGVLRAYEYEFDSLVPDTNQRLRQALATMGERENESPTPVQPWECRIGLSKFFIPPTSIDVSKVFKGGSMTAGALRQESTPKFNSGHTETQVRMTLLFPNYEQIWGFEDSVFEIDFDHDSAERVDAFLSSLRGLIAQFRYMPFLPVRNDYLNKAHGISAVCMQDLSLTSVEGFPFSIAASLTLLKFNHKVYMPMVDHFDQGVHWGRFRSFAGRASWRLTESSRPVVSYGSVGELNRTTLDETDYRPSIRTAEDVLSDFYADGVPQDHQYHRHSYAESDALDFYYPFHSPTNIDLPSIDEIAIDGSEAEGRSWWERMMGVLGFDLESNDNQYDEVQRLAESKGLVDESDNEFRTLLNWLDNLNQSVEFMGTGSLNTYIEERLEELGIKSGTPQAQELGEQIRSAWMVALYERMMEDSGFARALAFDQQRDRDMVIREWEIPMVKLNLDPSVVRVETIAVNRGNQFAPLQLQMEAEPTYQHIGGRDAHIEIQLIVSGENADDEIVKLRTMFETVSGLARVNRGHGSLGFLGIQNTLTELCGIRYVLPQQFNVETIPDYPGSYRVSIVLTDFDVFQQKREMLSNVQQAGLVEAFGKRNPFLRIRQLWGVFSAYPDFPLAVRDEDGAIIGNLDPDYYFRHFSTIDQDLIEYRTPDKPERPEELEDDLDIIQRLRQPNENYGDQTTSSDHNDLEDGVHVMLGKFEGVNSSLSLSSSGVSVVDGDQTVVGQGRFRDSTAGDVHTRPFVEGLAPTSRYLQPNFSYDDPSSQFHAMMEDERHRDQAGRMVRAFPTYMLWLIDEGGNYAGVRMFDNFYGLQSVLDFSIIRSEDLLGDTLVLNLSNLYSRLSTPFRDYVDDDRFGGRIINEMTKNLQRTLTGLNEYLVDLESITLKPGLRVHMRCGYGSNPNRLETVFNGIITDVQYGETMTVTCQSDEIELGTTVNTDDPEGHTGDFDGSFTGLFLSEPRDLMLSLLTQGTSTTRETIAHATRGRIFSENRFGIRHFGTILYEPMNEEEDANIERRIAGLSGAMAGSSPSESNKHGMIQGLVSFATLDLVQSLWQNLQARRDFEVFKRNIYPGNGVGVTQYAGGDLGDIGLYNAMDGSPLLTPQTGIDPNDNEGGAPVYNAGRDPREVILESIENEGLENHSESPEEDRDNTWWLPGALGTLYTASGASSVAANMFRSLGLTHEYESEDEIVEEVSFRAQTYMKTVWDLFQLCAALLPDYIVAVRPFEERSTVFYGKPHWLYTSGVVPLTSGAGPEDGPNIIEPNEEAARIKEKIHKQAESQDQVETFEVMFDEVAKRTQDGEYYSASPNTSDPEQSNGGNDNGPIPSGSVLERFMAGVREAESGNRYQAESDISTASGAYQYLDGTWNNYKGYSRAKHAPPEIQDERARQDFTRVFQQYGDWRVVAASHFRGSGWVADNPDPSSGAWDRNVPRQGRAITTREHIESMLNSAGITNYTDPDGIEGSSSDANRPPAEWESRRRRDEELEEEIESQWLDSVAEHGDDYLFENGWKDNGIPVNAAADEGGVSDPVGEAAAELYEDHRSNQYADEIWNNFRDHFNIENDDVIETFKSSPMVADLDDQQADELVDEVLEELVDDFKRLCWQNAAARGWVVRVANRRMNVVEWVDDIPLFELVEGAVGGIESISDLMQGEASAGDVAESLTWGPIGWVVEQFTGDDEEEGEFEEEGSLGSTVGDWLVQIAGGQSRDEDSGAIYDWIVEETNPRLWSFGPVYDAFGQYLQAGSDGALQYMRNNSDPGRDQGGIRSRAAETLGSGVASVLDSTQQIWESIGTLFSGVISFARLSMFQLSQGMSMASQESNRAAVINRVHNDSIYYNAGMDGEGRVDNRLLNLSDNPFTREYGEPVVEIREPFQRVHTLGSFQNIISNNIIATSSDVATVVTATSNEEHPVTVHFDKAAPAHVQREAVVDTGLHWDEPEGWFGGWLSPVQNSRHIARTLGIGRASDGTSSETSARRVALWHLKQHLKNIYRGEIVIVGDPSIRPHDLIYLGDVYERTYGFVECRQIIHHFTPETGFVSSVTPSAVVSINDPARYSYTSYWRGQKQIQDVRNHIRQSIGVTDAQQIWGGEYLAPEASGSDEELNLNGVLSAVESQLENSLQFTGGKNSLITDIAALAGAGQFAGAGMSPGGLVWKAWAWVRDNLIDQSGCYISYLTHHGQPMDAGLSQNHQSNAVGMQHGFSIVMGAMRLGPIPIMGPDGSPVIRTSDVVDRIQWTEYGPNDAAQEVSMFIEQTKTRVHQLTNIEPEGSPDLEGEIYLGTVIDVVDGGTFDFEVSSHVPGDDFDYSPGGLAGSVVRVGLAAVAVPDDPHRDSDLVRDSEASYPGVEASRYTENVLEGQIVALRVVVDAGRVDEDGTIRAYVFHNSPPNATGDDHDRFVLSSAGGWPAISWDSYMEDGRPYTFNWQTIAAGHGTVDVDRLRS